MFLVVSLVGVVVAVVSGFYPRTPVGMLLMVVLVGPVVGAVYLMGELVPTSLEHSKLGRWLNRDSSWLAPERIVAGVIVGLTLIAVWYWLLHVAWEWLPEGVHGFLTHHLGFWWLDIP